MKTLLTSFAFVLLHLSYAQTTVHSIDANGIYLSDGDYKNHHLLLSFNKKSSDHKYIDTWSHSHQVWIKFLDSTYKFYYGEIWGYRKDGEDWRVFDGEMYRIEDTTKICIYSIPTFIDGHTGYNSYFSKNLTTPIHSLTKNDLIEVYHTDTAFIARIKKLKWHNSLFKWDKNQQQYAFAGWLSRQ